MSRSRQHSPVTPNASGSEKRDKQRHHRRERAHQRRLLHDDPDGPPRREHHRSGDWNFAKDGRRWRGEKMPAKEWRK